MRNIPCETKPDKRSPTVEMCESHDQYVPLNDGLNWKGEPNATPSGQGVPQYAPGQDPRLPPPNAPPPVTAVSYDPATGVYIGPDGKSYVQADLAHAGDKTWQSMLVPPTR